MRKENEKKKKEKKKTNIDWNENVVTLEIHVNEAEVAFKGRYEKFSSEHSKPSLTVS